jgi:hypothetical protein
LCGFVARDLILPLALDVRDKSAVEAAVASLPADYAETNILVNNAGLSSIVRFKGDENRASNVYDGTKPLTAEDIADTVHWVVTRLGHVNIDTISMMPVCQAFAPLAIHRAKSKQKAKSAKCHYHSGHRGCSGMRHRDAILEIDLRVCVPHLQLPKELRSIGNPWI